MDIIRNNMTTWIISIMGVIGAGIFMVGEVFQWPAVSQNGALFIVSWVWVLLAVPLVVRERVLLVGILPGVAAVFAIWIPRVVAEVPRPEFVILLPLPLVAAFLLAWTPLAVGLFYLMRRWDGREKLAAGTETVAMGWLVLPWLLATVVLPSYLGLEDETVAVVAAIGIGLLWSKLISDPFARLVRAML